MNSLNTKKTMAYDVGNPSPIKNEFDLYSDINTTTSN